MASFGPIAKHYDLLMQDVPYEMWAGYYRLLLTQIDANPDTLLDVCCGTGILAELMSIEGYQVTGFDISEEMIEVAKAKDSTEQYLIQYIVADARDFEFGRKFDGAYSFFDSLNYITELSGLEKTIHQVAKHLNDEGTFVFDVNTEYAFTEQMFDQADTNQKADIQYEWKGEYDTKTKIIHVNMKFFKDGQFFDEVHVQRAHSHDEICQALNDAGFTYIRAFDSYTLDPPNKKSDRVHYIARL